MAGQDRVARAFNDAVNRRDLAGLEWLMTDDHVFVDSEGSAFSGRETVARAWKGFFDAFPDYRNVWADVVALGGVVVATGRSECASEPALDGPAIWTVTVRDGRVARWQVDEDTAEIRARPGLGSAGRD